MELLETDDMKSALLKKSAKHREDLENEVKLLSERTEKIVTNALIIGGSLAATYLLVRAFSGSKKKKKHRSKPVKVKVVRPRDETSETVEYEAAPPGIVSQIGTVLAGQATAFLLGLAKEKLASYLQSQSDKKETKS